ncbi:MAG: hypothetical protein P4L40_14955, partial [Terracidiphilus sp.]|nr:hypothetical protein [Terracidiphilus sp.]
MKSLLFLLFALFLHLPLQVVTISSCGYYSSTNIMAIGAFVDIYDTSQTPLAVLALSDGGAVFASLRADNGDPRVVRVNSNGGFEWFSEQRVATGDSTSYSYYPTALAQDSSAIYLVGYVSASPVKSFIIVYKLADGSYVRSAFLYKSASSASYIKDMIMSSAGTLVFVGYYGSTSTWIGTIDASTLAITQHTITGSSHSIIVPTKIVQASSSYYSIAGTVDSQAYLWVASVSTSWSDDAEYTSNSITAPTITGLAYASSTYGIIVTDTYAKPSWGNGISSTTFTGAQDIVASSDGSGSIVVGYTSGSSFAYYMSTSWGSECIYTGGQTASYSNAVFAAASKYSSSSSTVWVAGYLATSPYFAFVAELSEGVTVLSCSSSVNYLNSACYSSVTSTTCFGLCATCLIKKDINACYSGTSSAQSSAISLFAGRCGSTATHYEKSASACAAVTQTSCHKLCGGECLAANDPEKCAHHCIGPSIEANVITTHLWENICRCKLNMAFNDATQACEVVSDCYALCGSGGCGESNNEAMCVDCVSSATTTAITDSDYVKCSCTGQLGISGSTCAACSVLCDGCSAAADSTECTDCASGSNIDKVGTAAPYTCKCTTQTVLSGSSCLACHVLCDECTQPTLNTKCIACQTGANIVATGTSGAYTCACASQTVLSGSACLACHALCDECTAPGDNTKCKACVSDSNVQKTGSTSPYTCSCKKGTAFSSATGKCEPCYALCDGCLVSADNSQCSACIVSATVKTTGTSAPYTCTCVTQTILSSGACAACHPLCNECLLPSDSTQCLACVSDTNVETASTSSPYTCTCKKGTAYSTSSGKCEPCYDLCDGCTLPADQTACQACISASNIVATGTSGAYTCTCATQTVLSSGACVACHPLCNECVTPGVNTGCKA